MCIYIYSMCIYIYSVYYIYTYDVYELYIYMIRNDLGIGLLESGDILFDPSFGLKTWYKPSEQLDSFSESIHVGKAPHIVSISINIYIYVCVWNDQERLVQTHSMWKLVEGYFPGITKESARNPYQLWCSTLKIIG